MKAKNAEEYTRRGQSGSSRSTKRTRKSSTRRRMLRSMSAGVRQQHRDRKLTYSQSQGTVIVNPAIDPAKRVDFLEWFTAILDKDANGNKAQPSKRSLFRRMHDSVMEEVAKEDQDLKNNVPTRKDEKNRPTEYYPVNQ